VFVGDRHQKSPVDEPTASPRVDHLFASLAHDAAWRVV